MSDRNTFIRSAHDVGLAAWFGGSLMGAVGLNGAAAQAKTSQEVLRLSSVGWARWAPVNALAIGAHAVGGIGLMIANKKRIKYQKGTQANTTVKAALTVVAVGLSVYSGILGKKINDKQDNPTSGVTEPAAGADDDLASAQRQLQYCQWALPAVTGVLVVMGAQQGEQQRPSQQGLGRLKNAVSGN